MKITYSHIDTDVRVSIEQEFERHIDKLNRLLERYASDLVKLHASVEKVPRKTQYCFSLNLILPTGTLHASGDGADVRAGAKVAFAEIEKQVKKHQQKLRKDYLWKRKQGRGAVKMTELRSTD
jgi:ribosomal subunit interface protein